MRERPVVFRIGPGNADGAQVPVASSCLVRGEGIDLLSTNTNLAERSGGS